MRLQNKVAIITGAGGGQGRAASIIFAREGAKVVAAGWRTSNIKETVELVKAEGGEAAFVQADVSKARDVEKMVAFAISQYGKIDVLHNNAGVGYSFGRMAPVVDTPEEDWDIVTDIDLKSVYLCCRHTIPEMIRQGSGSIINVSSVNGLIGIHGADAYTASKGGVIALTRALANDLGPKGIRVNCICPGTIETPMAAGVLKDIRTRRYYENLSPLRRIGRPEDVAYAALYLASDESSFVTGTILVVDGGMTATLSRA